MKKRLTIVAGTEPVETQKNRSNIESIPKGADEDQLMDLLLWTFKRNTELESELKELHQELTQAKARLGWRIL